MSDYEKNIVRDSGGRQQGAFLEDYARWREQAAAGTVPYPTKLEEVPSFEVGENPVRDSVATKVTTLPTDSNERKGYPITRGCLNYFPAAIAGVARVSMTSNEKHNPGEPMHHAREKSTDHSDCIARHLMDTEALLIAEARGAGVTKEEILTEVSQLAWRALAYSQALHEKYGAPLAPAAVNKGKG